MTAGADFEALWQALPTPALLLDAEGRVREANDAAEVFLGLSRSALADEHLVWHLVPHFGGTASAGCKLAELIGRALGGETPGGIAAEVVCPGSPPRPVEIMASSVRSGVLIVVQPRPLAGAGGLESGRYPAAPRPDAAPETCGRRPDRRDRTALAAGRSLRDAVEIHLGRYFRRHGRDLPPPGLYDRVRREIEHPLITLTLAATRGNQLRAADLLGLNRNTLRKKIRELDIPVTRGRKTSVD